ncbi:hypothetical protein BUC_1772 [Burkholderia pseudomallei 576]|nr:hypothetical protein BUC_1772 [Burkholderia pseudomallei 576]
MDYMLFDKPRIARQRGSRFALWQIGAETTKYCGKTSGALIFARRPCFGGTRTEAAEMFPQG